MPRLPTLTSKEVLRGSSAAVFIFIISLEVTPGFFIGAEAICA
jgi:hypothetical protein